MGFGVDISGEVGKSTTTRKTGRIDWNELKKILNLDIDMNRINRYGPFGGWEYDPQTNSQRFVATDPGMQAAQERMSRRLGGEGFEKYEPPAQVSAMTDALMASRMERMGLLGEGSRPNLAQENYGTRFGDRQGGAYRDAMITPPPPQASPGGPPPGGPPPGGRPPWRQPPGVRPPSQGIRPPGSYPPFYNDER
jgi:hypothetical protein